MIPSLVALLWALVACTPLLGLLACYSGFRGEYRRPMPLPVSGHHRVEPRWLVAWGDTPPVRNQPIHAWSIP
jgi:hypothetical protein